MKPEVIRRQVANAKAVAAGLHDAASVCGPDQDALRARLMGGAREIDVLIALVESLEHIAKINHDTIVQRRAS